MGIENQRGWSNLAAAAVFVAGLLAVPRVARADRPAPLSAQTLTAPSGPTSLRGLGESFSANPATGTGAYAIPISLPPGFITPKVALKYTGGTGRGELGVGFSLAVLQIYRQTDKGAPKFTEADRFAVSGPDFNDELIAVDSSRKLFRMKNEGAFILFERDAANDLWRVRHPDGTQSFLGQTVASRGQSLGRTARWYVEQTQDANNHLLAYRYIKDGGRVYLSAIDYQQEASAAYRNRVDFEYESRADVTKDFSYGDEITLGQRLRTIEVRQGTRLLRRYSLDYDTAALWSLLTQVRMEGEQGLNLPTLRLGYLGQSSRSGRFVRTEGFRSLTGLDTGRMTLEDVNGDGLPDLLSGASTSYEYYENLDGVKFSGTPVQLGVSGSPDRDLEGQSVVLADVDGDGYRDVWFAAGTQLRYYPGGTIQAGRFQGFGSMQVMNPNGILNDVTTADIRLTDLNGDGRVDLLRQRTGTNDVWIENVNGTQLVQNAIPTLPAGVQLSGKATELADFNGDGILDLILKEFDSGKHSLKIWYGLGSGKYRSPEVNWAAPAAFADEVHLSDVNRDGQLDFIRVSGSWVGYWLNDGRGSYSVQHGDFRGMPSMSRTKKLVFADMNGNGTTDVVWVTTDGGMSYLDLLEEPNVGLLSRVDNGMGMVTEISYRSSTDYQIESKLRGEPWATPMPHAVPVIAEVRTKDSLDQLGFFAWESRTRFDYADGYYDGKEREFRGFGRVTETTMGDVYQPGAVVETRFYVGRNLTTGADEEGLKGKPYLRVIRDDIGQVYSTTETHWEQRWLCQESLGSGVSAVLPQCNAIIDKTAHKDELVALAVSVDTLNGAWEKTAAPRYSATHNVYDVWGNPTRSESYGEVSFSGGHAVGGAWDLSTANVTVGNDEQVVETDYIYDVAKWIVGIVKETRSRSWAGELQSDSRFYYDGTSYVGLPLGQVDKGRLSRKESWLNSPDSWIPVERIAYNEHGLPVGKKDPAGNLLEIEYDTETRTNPIVERFQIDSGVAEFRATWDAGLGAMTSLRNPNGQTTNYRYDGLGRLTKVIDPLGSDAEPLTAYEYQFGNPISTTISRKLVTRGTGQYHSSYTYSDGLGRSRLTKTEAEASKGYVAVGSTRMSPGGAVGQDFQPFATNNIGYEEPPAATPNVQSFYDPMGRVLEVVLPAVTGQTQARTTTTYLPFETRAYGERDNAEGVFDYPAITRIDGLGRIREIEKSNPVGQVVQKMIWRAAYYASGELASLTDPKGGVRNYGYDSLGRLTSLNDPNIGQVSYQYNASGQMLSRREGSGREKRFAYGLAGRLAKVEYAATSGGAAQETHIYHYDVAASNSPITSPKNLIGKLAWVEGPVSAEHFSYDELDRMTEHAMALWDGKSPIATQTRNSYVEQMTYNAAGDMTAKKLPGGFELAYGYNTRGLVDTVRGGFGGENRSIFSGAAFDVQGRAVELTNGNATKACQRFDQRGRLTGNLVGAAAQVGCSDIGVAGRGLQHLTYQWGFDGTLAATVDMSSANTNARRQDGSFQYDRIRQLLKATTPQGDYEYNYDEIQNLVSRKTTLTGGTALAETLEYGSVSNGPNRVTKVGTKSFSYDAQGDIQQYNGFDLSFDAEGRLTKAEKSGQKILRYYYDSFGNRRLLTVERPSKPTDVYQYPFSDYEIRKGEEHFRVENGVTAVEVTRGPGIEIDAYLLDELTNYAANPAGRPKPLPAEYMDLDRDGDAFDAADLTVALNGYWNGQVVGGQRTVWRYYHRDLLGSTASVTDSSGAIVSAVRHHPYGETAERQGGLPARGFAGSEVEPEQDLGLIRMGARYYAPGLGRWVTPDRFIGEQPEKMLMSPLEANLYSYSMNSPTSFKDPTGTEGRAVMIMGGPEVTRTDQARTYRSTAADEQARDSNQDRYQRNARRFQSQHSRQYDRVLVESLKEDEVGRFGDASADSKKAGGLAHIANERTVLDAITKAADSAKNGGSVILVGHGGANGSSAAFQIGVGNRTFIMDSTELAQGRYDDFLKKVGNVLRENKIPTLRIVGCNLAQSEDFTTRIAKKLGPGIGVQFNKDMIVFSDRGTYSALADENHREIPGTQNAQGLVASDVGETKYAPAAGDPLDPDNHNL